MGSAIGKIGGIFGGAPASTTTIVQAAPVAPPTRSDTDVQAAAEAERKRRRLAGGRSSTILTGDEGVTGSANVARPTLLGGPAQAMGA